MEIALRKSDREREWLASFNKVIKQIDKVITQHAFLDIYERVTLDLLTDFDLRTLHLPALWKIYHDRLVKGKFGNGGGFWVAMIREKTQERLEVARGEKKDGHGLGDAYSSGWYREYIETHSELWNEDVLDDVYSGGEFLGGKEHWSQFAML
jgi:hypothetical protein